MSTANGGTDAPVDLASPANPRVKDLVRLRTRRSRDASGRTLVEGHDELRLALDAGVRPVEVYWAPSLVRPEQLPLADELRRDGVVLRSVSRPVFDKISYRESPDGWLAVAATPGVPVHAVPLSAEPLVLVGEAIEKPGNLGAMTRTAEAFGADAVVSASAVTDFGNPNTIRASKGSVFAVPVASAPSGEVIAWLRRSGIRIAATTPNGGRPVDEVDLTGPVAVVVGAESTGLTDLWLDEADDRVLIPMSGRINSLNAATAAALVLYEATRQRRTR